VGGYSQETAFPRLHARGLFLLGVSPVFFLDRDGA